MDVFRRQPFSEGNTRSITDVFSDGNEFSEGNDATTRIISSPGTAEKQLAAQQHGRNAVITFKVTHSAFHVNVPGMASRVSASTRSYASCETGQRFWSWNQFFAHSGQFSVYPTEEGFPFIRPRQP